jgi:hypothetical protein
MADSQCLHYRYGILCYAIPFADDGETCHDCPLLREDKGCRRHYCEITREILFAPFDGRGRQCPVYFPEGEGEVE